MARIPSPCSSSSSPRSVSVYRSGTKADDIDVMVGVLTGIVRVRPMIKRSDPKAIVSPILFVPMLLLYSNDGWRLCDLCKRMQYDHGNMHRMMARLMKAGMIYRDSDRGYHLTSFAVKVIEKMLTEIAHHTYHKGE